MLWVKIIGRCFFGTMTLRFVCWHIFPHAKANLDYTGKSQEAQSLSRILIIFTKHSTEWQLDSFVTEVFERFAWLSNFAQISAYMECTGNLLTRYFFWVKNYQNYYGLICIVASFTTGSGGMDMCLLFWGCRNNQRAFGWSLSSYIWFHWRILSNIMGL